MKKLLLFFLLTCSISLKAQNIDTVPCLNTALNFSGGPYLKIANVGDYLVNRPKTVEVWIKTSGAAIKPIICSAFDYGWGLFVEGTNVLFARVGGPNPSYTMAIDANVWTHVAVVYVGTQVKYYKNGILQGSDDNYDINFVNEQQPPGSGEDDYYIGRSIVNQQFTGDIDELRVWGIDRSATDILDNMDNELTGNENGLLLYYKFNEQSSASYAADEVSTNHALPQDGSINRSSTVTPPECIIIGIKEQEIYNVTISPNPANEILSIDVQDFQQLIADKSEIFICDLQGRQVYKSMLTQQRTTIDVSSFANGLYLLSLQSSKGATTKRIEIVKQ